MKKKLLFSVLSLTATSLCALTFASSANEVDSPVKAEGESTLVREIVFNDQNFERTEGNLDLFVGNRNHASFWGHRRFNAVGDFYNGEENEGQTGVLRTKGTFKQTTNYISFTLGGNPGDINNPENYVELIKVSGETEQSIGKICNTYWNDPKLCWNMITYVFEIDDAHLNSDMYIKIVDNRTGGFGGVVFGNLYVNQTIADVGLQIARHRASVIETNQFASGESNSWNYAAALYTFEKYANEEYYQKFTQNGYDPTYVPNEDFEEQYGWESDWYFDVSYSRFTDKLTEWADSEYAWQTDFRAHDASSDWEGEDIGGNWTPYTREGNRLFRGAQTMGESIRYRLNSNPFKLQHDYITVKMGGRVAELQLIDAVTFNVVATLRNQAFEDGNLDQVYKKGTGLVTLSRHVWNISEFRKGTELNPNAVYILALADAEFGGNWGCALFDSVTFTNNIGFKVDVVTQNGNHGTWFDRYAYASLGGSVDTSATLEAYNFLHNIGNVTIGEETTVDLNGRGFYKTFRNTENRATFCGEYSSTDEYRAVLTAYNNLSNEAKAILANSEDFEYVSDVFTSDVAKTYTVADTMSFALGYDGYVSGVELYSNYLFESNSVAFTFIVITLLVVLSVSSFFLLKKRIIKR